MLAMCWARLAGSAKMTVAITDLPLPSVIDGKTVSPRALASLTVVVSCVRLPTSATVPSGWALKKNGDTSENRGVAAAFMNPARPSGAFQYGTQPLRKPFGVHALRPIIAAATKVARQKPLRRALAIRATLLGPPRGRVRAVPCGRGWVAPRQQGAFLAHAGNH